MRTAVLFSGGKDSCMALHYAKKFSEVVCLISIVSKNQYSYMFHTPNISLTKIQAEVLKLPLLIQETKGEKEKELKDLEKAIKKAKEEYKIEGIITGALASNYQASRIQTICDKLKLKCFNPLWQKDQIVLLEEILKLKFKVIIVGTFALELNKFIGNEIDEKILNELKILREKTKINPAGEGGEYESFVLNSPDFSRELKIKKSHVESQKDSAVMIIDKIE
jgi:ABC transporter with metal-binding/Fe-S-binding domain ATP-binding protein